MQESINHLDPAACESYAPAETHSSSFQQECILVRIGETSRTHAPPKSGLRADSSPAESQAASTPASLKPSLRSAVAPGRHKG